MGATGDVSLVFHTKLLLQSPLICYCVVENHFTEVKKDQNLIYL